MYALNAESQGNCECSIKHACSAAATLAGNLLGLGTWP